MQDHDNAQPPPRHFLLMDNPSKTTHLGTLLRCAAAFRAHQVLIVGHDKFNAQGSFGSHLYLDIVAFPSWECVVDYLERGAKKNDVEALSSPHQTHTLTISPSKQERVPIVGILGAYGGDEAVYSSDGLDVYEDSATDYATLSPTTSETSEQKKMPHKSYPLHNRPFSTDTCFFLSKDKRGLPIKHARICHSYVHVPQICFDTQEQEKVSRIVQSTLLETATIYSITLHHFTAWAKYDERSFADNQKFVKDTKSDMRRRLCRRYRQNLTSAEKDDEHESQDEDALILEQSGGVFASDY